MYFIIDFCSTNMLAAQTFVSSFIRNFSETKQEPISKDSSSMEEGVKALKKKIPRKADILIVAKHFGMETKEKTHLQMVKFVFEHLSTADEILNTSMFKKTSTNNKDVNEHEEKSVNQLPKDTQNKNPVSDGGMNSQHHPVPKKPSDTAPPNTSKESQSEDKNLVSNKVLTSAVIGQKEIPTGDALTDDNKSSQPSNKVTGNGFNEKNEEGSLDKKEDSLAKEKGSNEVEEKKTNSTEKSKKKKKEKKNTQKDNDLVVPESIRNLKGAKENKPYKNKKANIVSFDMDTNLFLLGLFIVREQNLDSMIENLGGISATDAEDKGDMLKRNAVFFGPPANHHCVKHSSFTNEFIKTTYKGEGSFSITENNKINVIFYQISEYQEGVMSQKHMWNLDSLSPVEYYDSIEDKTTGSEIIQHQKKIGVPFRNKKKGTIGQKLQKLLWTISKFSYRKLNSSHDLILFGKELNIDCEELEAESYFQDATENRKFNIVYKYLANSVQEKFKLGAAIPEGLHRIVLTLRAAYGDYITNKYHILKDEMEEKKETVDFEKTPLTDLCTVKFEIPMVSLPNLQTLRERSSLIRKGQNLGHNRTFSDMLTDCLNEFQRKKNNSAPHYTNLLKSTKDDWYGHQIKPQDDPILKFNIERKAKMKETKNPEEKKSIKKEIDAQQDKALVQLFTTYGEFLELKGQYIFIASYFLPGLFFIINDFFHFDKKYADQKNLHNNDKEQISKTKYEIFKLVQLSTYDKSFVMPSEFLRGTNTCSLKVPFRHRVILEFLRVMLMYEENREILKFYCLKNEGSIVWKQSPSREEAFFPSDIYEYEFIEKIIGAASKISVLFTDFVFLNNNRNVFRKKKLQSIFFESVVLNLMTDVLSIGPLPEVDVDTLKEKIGENETEMFFDKSAQKQAKFLSVMLDLYTNHATKYISSLYTISDNFLSTVIHCIEGLPKRKSFDSSQENLMLSTVKITPEDLRINDFEMPNTPGKNAGYALKQGTRIPGSFYFFCASLATAKYGKDLYKDFNILPRKKDQDTSNKNASERTPQSKVAKSLERKKLLKRKAATTPTNQQSMNQPRSRQTPTRPVKKRKGTTSTPREQSIEETSESEESAGDDTNEDLLLGFDQLFNKQKKEWIQDNEIKLQDFFIDTIALLKEQLPNHEDSKGYDDFESVFLDTIDNVIPKQIREYKINFGNTSSTTHMNKDVFETEEEASEEESTSEDESSL